MSEFTLESSAFEEGGSIPRQHTCDGKDSSPPLSWTDAPEKTASFALLVEDPDAPGKTWVHWVLYDLPPTTASLPEGVPQKPKLESGGVQGVNDFRKVGYGGPCPPSGTHRYIFELSAVDRRLGLPAGSNRDQVAAAMEGHILAKARLTGRYSRSRG